MADTMKERIARAIIECDGRLLRSNDLSAVEARAYAEAVLAAMRDAEPNEVMKSAMWSLAHTNTTDSFRTVWQAMIDAAISEGKE